MRIYIVEFQARKRGALGLCYRLTREIQSPIDLTDRQIILKLYDSYDHISRVKIDVKKVS